MRHGHFERRGHHWRYRHGHRHHHHGGVEGARALGAALGALGGSFLAAGRSRWRWGAGGGAYARPVISVAQPHVVQVPHAPLAAKVSPGAGAQLRRGENTRAIDSQGSPQHISGRGYAQRALPAGHDDKSSGTN